jgi:hypothetical protein
MASMDELEQDLRYVRSAVERSDTSPAPRLISFLWAVLGGVGFALIDLRDSWVPGYWMVAGPGGFLLSAWLGWRHARRTGYLSAAQGARQMLHWGAMLAAVFLLMLMPARGLMAPNAIGPAILLILALGHFTAGLYLYPALRWTGVLLAAGYLFVLFETTYAWVVLGVLFAVALVVSGLRASTPDAAA